jgi:hypothetical protein
MSPFDLDCADRYLPTAATMQAQLVRLIGVVKGLEPDAVAVLLLVAERLAKGRARYGNLDVSHDPRCFPVEALEEAADGLVYAAVALMRGQRP